MLWQVLLTKYNQRDPGREALGVLLGKRMAELQQDTSLNLEIEPVKACATLSTSLGRRVCPRTPRIHPSGRERGMACMPWYHVRNRQRILPSR